MAPSLAIRALTEPVPAAACGHIGGDPQLPPDVSWPDCRLCGAALTFFFQLAFPSSHAWSGKTLAMFSCVACADEAHLIPEMLQGPLQDATVPAAFLAAYQRNFRTFVFSTGQDVAHRYSAPILFHSVTYSPLGALPRIGQMGGRPDWLLAPEAPAKRDDGAPFAFLFQLDEDLRFPIHPGAPVAMEINLFGKPEPGPHRFYQLFLGNRIFFFGAGEGDVYIITQID